MRYNRDSYPVFSAPYIVLKRSKHDLLSLELSDVARHISTVLVLPSRVNYSRFRQVCPCDGAYKIEARISRVKRDVRNLVDIAYYGQASRTASISGLF